MESSLSALYRYISLFVVGVATWVATQMFLEIDLPWQVISRIVPKGGFNTSERLVFAFVHCVLETPIFCSP
jgi:hypothetical protein